MLAQVSKMEVAAGPRRGFRWRAAALVVWPLLLAALGGAVGQPSPAHAFNLSPAAVAATDTVTIVATSDIHYGRGSAADAFGREDSQLALAMNPDYVVPVGDWVDGPESATQYADKVDPDWGALKARFRSTIGNHEYENTTDYDAYFPPGQRTAGTGDKATEDYWSWDTSNGWHVVSLNLNLSQSQGSAQYNWLAADLASNREKPTIVFDHAPRYSDGMRGDQPYLAAIWGLAMQQKADMFISGHDHGYQRWQRLNNSKQADPNGVRQLVVGVGGYGDNSVYGLPYNSSPLREFASVAYHGVVKLTLHANSYDIEFYRVPSEGGGIVDAVYDQPVLNLRQTGPDTTPPAVPAGLTATVAGPTTINLAWSASTDDVGVAGYTIYRNGSTLAVVGPGVTTYSDHGLLAETTYRYEVDAFDLAGNHSATSTQASATTPAPDSSPPTTPVGLTVAALSSSTIRLAWSASTDNVGVAGYSINRDGAGVGTVGGSVLSYDDAGLAPATTHTYDVTAFDATGNYSEPSAPASGTTKAAAPVTFIQAATVVTGSQVRSINLNLRAVAAGDLLVGWFGQYRSAGQVHVSDPINGAWTRAGVSTTYGSGGDIAVYYVANTRAAPSGLTVTIGSDTATYLAGTAEEYSGVATVAPFDKGTAATGSGLAASSGSISPSAGGELIYGAITTDNDPGTVSAGQGLTLRAAFDTTAAEDLIASAAGPVSARFDLTSSTGWHVAVAAFKTQVADANPPSTPIGVVARAGASGEVTVSWGAATDDVAVAGYTVFRDGAALASAPASTLVYTDRTANGMTTYSYAIDAYDAAGNHSGRSTAATITTPDWSPPTTPTGLRATVVSSSEVDVTWNASTDNVGVAGYTVYRDDTVLAVVPGPTVAYTDGTVADGRSYRYTVDAFDAAGNRSAVAPAAVAAVPDITPPSAPTGVTAVALSPTSVQVSWQPSSDNVGVAGYTVYRDGSELGSLASGQLTLVDTVTVGSTHAYSVAAFDAAGHVSAASPAVVVTTPEGDTVPPSVPAGVAVKVLEPSLVEVTWNAATDDVAVMGYTVYRNNTVFTVVGATTLGAVDRTVSPSADYTYAVDAFDGAGNHSAPSPAVQVHVPGAVKFKQANVAASGKRLTTLTLSLGPVPSGDLLVGWFGQYDATGQVIVSDNVNGAWTRSASTTWRGTANAPGDIALYYFANSAAAPAGLTITISASRGTYLQGGAADYSGVAAVNPLDAVAVAKGSGKTATSGLTPAVQPGELVYGGLVVTNNAGTLTPGTSGGIPFVKRAQTSSGTQGEEDILSGAAGQQQASFGLGTSAPWFIVCAVFRPA